MPEHSVMPVGIYALRIALFPKRLHRSIDNARAYRTLHWRITGAEGCRDRVRAVDRGHLDHRRWAASVASSALPGGELYSRRLRGFPRGPVLVAIMAFSAIAGVLILRGHRAGWLLGIGVAATSLALYVFQETGGLPGLEQTSWEPTRIASLLCAVLFIILARRRLAVPRQRSAGTKYSDRSGEPR
jgi:hypothetical protein